MRYDVEFISLCFYCRCPTHTTYQVLPTQRPKGQKKNRNSENSGFQMVEGVRTFELAVSQIFLHGCGAVSTGVTATGML